MHKGPAGSSQGVVRFGDELAARARQAGADGQVTLRARSGFWLWKLVDTLTRHGVLWSITGPQHNATVAAIATIAEDSWVDIDYTRCGRVQVAEPACTTGKGNMKCTAHLGGARGPPDRRRSPAGFPGWRLHLHRHPTGTASAD